jgi:pyridoxine 4-dehydrogenase
MAEDLTVTRMGYGAMQLAGPHVFGPPADRDAAVAVLREAIELGITHIDTSDFYGPYVTNQIIKEALHPYPDSTCTSSPRSERCETPRAAGRTRAPGSSCARPCTTTWSNLGLDALDVVNLRVGGFDSPEPGSHRRAVHRPRAAAAGRTDQAPRRQHRLRRADRRSPVHRADRVRAELLQRRPPGRRRPDRLPRRAGHRLRALLPARRLLPAAVRGAGAVAARLDATPMAVALAWLLQRSPNILLIPGTSSVAHLRDNVTGAALTLSGDDADRAQQHRLMSRRPEDPRPCRLGYP